MKVLSVTLSTAEIVETDDECWDTYRRYNFDAWEQLIGDSWEPVYSGLAKIEAAYQLFVNAPPLPTDMIALGDRLLDQDVDSHRMGQRHQREGSEQPMITYEELKRRILEHLTHSPMRIDRIVNLVDEPVAVVATTLALMELCDEVTCAGKMSYALPIPELMSRARTVEGTVYIMRCTDLDEAISKYLGRPFSIAVAEEMPNGSSWMAKIDEVGPGTDRYGVCQYTVRQLRKQSDDEYLRTTVDVLDLMCGDGLLLPGRYLVKIFW